MLRLVAFVRCVACPEKKTILKSEVSTAVTLKNAAFCDVTPWKPQLLHNMSRNDNGAYNL
jgi:hypothetical protein